MPTRSTARPGRLAGGGRLGGCWHGRRPHNPWLCPPAERKVDPSAINVMTGATYEKEFDLEMKRVSVGGRPPAGPAAAGAAGGACLPLSARSAAGRRRAAGARSAGRLTPCGVQCHMQEAKTRSTPWGSSYRAPPEVLHGYSGKVGRRLVPGRSCRVQRLQAPCNVRENPPAAMLTPARPGNAGDGQERFRTPGPQSSIQGRQVLQVSSAASRQQAPAGGAARPQSSMPRGPQPASAARAHQQAPPASRRRPASSAAAGCYNALTDLTRGRRATGTSGRLCM